MGKHFSGSPGFRRSLAQSEISTILDLWPQGRNLFAGPRPWLSIEPNLHRAQKQPTQSADRSTETVDGVDQPFL